MRPALVGVPYDAGSSFRRGAARAPAAIRAALASPAGNAWSESGVEVDCPGALEDAGDLDLPDDAAAARAAIEAGVAAILRRGRTPLALGGNHAVTHPILRAVHAARGPVAVLHIDAHPDLYEAYGGDRHSHACPFARVMEDGLAGRLVQVGIRAATGHQRDQARRFGVETVDMRAWAAGTRPRVDGPVYVSIDLDGLDPAFAPAVAHPEPGGLSVRDVLGLLFALPGPVVGADIVECQPDLDASGLTVRVAAKLAREVAARVMAAGA